MISCDKGKTRVAALKIILKLCIEHRQIANTKGLKALFLMIKNCYNSGVEKRYKQGGNTHE